MGYAASGATALGGAAVTTKETAMQLHQQMTVLGLPLSEVALIVGILGTLLTVIFQYLNYRDNHNRIQGDRDNNE